MIESICCESEVWKFLKELEPYYMVSSCGRVISCRQKGGPREPNRIGVWRELRQHLTPLYRGHRHLDIYLYDGPKRLRFAVHRLIYMTFIGDISNDYVVDHINHNPLDNHLANLRLATQAQNQINNKNPNRGICIDKRRPCKPYKVSISVNYKKLDLGHFSTFEEAYEVRKNAELLYYGEFSNKIN